MKADLAQPFDPAVTIAVVSPSCRGAVGDVPQAVAAKETSATTRRVSWRRDMVDSGVGKR
jgi:hypothetical protein